MLNRVLLLSTAAVTLLGAGPAFADQTAPTPDVAGSVGANGLDTLVVTATRSPQEADRVGQSVTVLDQKAIQASQATVVSDLLAQTPGVAFSRNGGVGQTTSVRIRGAEADQTVLVVDGVKLNDPSDPGGGYDFSNLMTGDISRIEILRGAQSTLWGSQAIGGVVNIVTAAPTRPFEASVDAEGGSMAAAYLRAGVGGAGDRVVWRLAASSFSTSGVSAYRFGTEPDGYHSTGFSGRTDVKLTDDVSLDLRAVYTWGRNDFDGFPPPAFVFADDSEFGISKDLVTYAGLNFGLFGGRLKNRLSFGYTSVDRDYYDPTQAVTPLTFSSLGQNDRWEYQGVFDIAPGWDATFGAEREDARMRTASPSSFQPNPPPLTASNAIDSLYAQVQGTVAQGLTLTGGVRHDNDDTYGSKVLGQAAAAWSLNGGATVLRASFGQGFKAPTLYELYSPYGNIALAPEQANSWDAGIEQTVLGVVKLTATYFGSRSRNEIDFVDCVSASKDPLCTVRGAPRFGYYANVTRTRADGIELAGSTQLGPVELQANYTYTDARNDETGSPDFDKLLARRPKNQANAQATYVWPFKLSTTLAVEYVGANFDDAADTTPIKGHALVDIRASYPINRTLELYGRIENLTNLDYETTHDYGSPRRAAYVGLRARL